MNLNLLARKVASKEGGVQSLSIAQIKEVLRCFADVCYETGDDHVFLEICSRLYLGAKKRLGKKEKK